MVYKWFLLIYKISYIVGIFGYLTMMATFLGFNLIFNVKPSAWMDTGLLCMFYALYYGVMARCAVCSLQRVVYNVQCSTQQTAVS